MPLINMLKKNGPNTDPRGTPDVAVNWHDFIPLHSIHCNGSFKYDRKNATLSVEYLKPFCVGTSNLW